MPAAVTFPSRSDAQAFALLVNSLGQVPTFQTRLSTLPSLALVEALIDLEHAFGIDLEVDEVHGLTVRGLINLVNSLSAARPSRAPPQRTSAIFDLAAYRAAVRPNLRPVDAFGAEPPLSLDPAVVDAAFPPTPAPDAKPTPRLRMSLGEFLSFIAIGLVLATATLAYALGRHQPIPASPAAEALADAVR